MRFDLTEWCDGRDTNAHMIEDEQKILNSLSSLDLVRMYARHTHIQINILGLNVNTPYHDLNIFATF